MKWHCIYVILGCVLIHANMNGLYQVASGTRQDTQIETNFTRRGFKYFDVYSPEIATRYAEVHWADAPQLDLPYDIVTRFKNRTLVIVGYEADQVFVFPQGRPGLNPDLDRSIPITWAYNHHYNIRLYGSGYYNIPDYQEFSEGNGGEYRTSYHGYPPWYGQLLYSPAHYIAMPMQIDTRNRSCGVTPNDIGRCATQHMFGPEPKQARYGRPDPNMNVSGLIHCPCTSSFGGDPVIYGPNTLTKTQAEMGFILDIRCMNQAIPTARDCFTFAKSLGSMPAKPVNSSLLPSGCILLRDNSGDQIVFNTWGESNIVCFNNLTLQRRGTLTQDKVGMNFTMIVETPRTILYKISGSADAWFAVGFNAQRMMDLPWTIVIYPNGTFEERLLGYCNVEGNHCSGSLLNTTLQSVSMSKHDGILDIVLRGPISTGRYDFSKQIDIKLVMAQGNDENLVYHKNRVATKILVLPENTGDTGLCACMTQFGALCDAQGANCVGFIKDCEDDLITTNNPTCSSTTYGGGLSCCTHRRVLLDADQINHGDNSLLRYHLKWRFYYDDGPNEAKYETLYRLYFQTESNAGEYDVVPAFSDNGTYPIVGYSSWPRSIPTPGTVCENGICMHVLKHKFRFRDIYDMKLIMVSGHCHAPRCKRMELWLDGKILCVQIPIQGQGLEKRFDEAGYLTIPPCLFDEDGYLDPPKRISSESEFLSVKYTENTHNGNFGEMASWQMRGAII